jgi:two-component system CheB/CheR fusion protein
LGELTHRVRNILAVIQAIARQTLNSSASKEAFVERLEGRLATLANAHALLVQSDWGGADLAELAHHQLDVYATDNRDRLRIEGEPVLLPADLATPVGLVLHELATNAVKHGALGNPQGKVAVRWAVERRNNQPYLRFEWKETGGPPAAEPATHGFGSTLIASGIPGAKVTRAFKPEGLACTIEFSFAEAADNGQVGER